MTCAHDWLQVLTRASEAYGRMILETGLFQADGHPGNILVMKGGKVGLIDYGQSKQLTDQDRLLIAKLIIALNTCVPLQMCTPSSMHHCAWVLHAACCRLVPCEVHGHSGRAAFAGITSRPSAMRLTTSEWSLNPTLCLCGQQWDVACLTPAARSTRLMRTRPSSSVQLSVFQSRSSLCSASCSYSVGWPTEWM
jgi:ABC1 atypical kinase-like domain